MKRNAILGAISTFAAAGAFAQGLVTFENSASSGAITIGPNTGPASYAPAGTYTVALLWAPGTTQVPQNSLQVIATFGPAGTYDGYFTDPNTVVTPNATCCSQPAVFEVMAWTGNYTTYAEAAAAGAYIGASAEFVNGTGKDIPPAPPPVQTTGWDGNLILALPGPVQITSQPQSLIVNAYDPATFAVGTTGSYPYGYQWYLNGANISRATNSSLTISNVTQSNLGTYSVVVSNPLNSVTSSNATLSMCPYIATPFSGAIGYWGKDITLTVGAWGTGPLTFQWFFNGTAVPNATDAALTLTSLQFTNAGLYSVAVTSPLGTATNPPAQLVVNPAGVLLGLYPGVTVEGVTGYTYEIQRTANISDTNSWVTLTNLTLAQPTQIWVDTSVNVQSPTNPKYFYRVLPGQ